MAFKRKVELSADKTITLGGSDPVSGKANPTRIEGYYLGARATPDKGYGPGLLQFFQTQEGNVGVWSKTKLTNALTKDLAGQMVRVTFKGMGAKTKGRNPAYLYEVEHDEENTIDVSGVDLSATPAQEPDYDDEDAEESDVDHEEAPLDEAPPARAAAPRQPAAAPDAARQAKVQALLNKGRNRTV